MDPAHAVATCLTTSTQCGVQGVHPTPAADRCAVSEWPRSCLTTAIPAWHSEVTHARVECCFRCCLLFWTRRLGLDDNEEHWRSRGVDHFVSQGVGGKRRDDAPLPAIAPLHFALHPRFGISRFAHWQAIERRDLVWLNASTPASVLRSSRFRAPRTWRANGSLVVLNKWGHEDEPGLMQRIGETLPRGPVALVYGDDVGWRAPQLLQIRHAFAAAGRPLATHFAMNLDADALRSQPHALQVPIGLNSASQQLPVLLREHAPLPPSKRSHELLCCCQRPWPWRLRIFEQLRANGFPHCNLTERRHYTQLMADYATHRFVVSVFGHGRSDFREWEALLHGAVPIIQYFPEQDALLEGLPIVRVADWATLTPTFLEVEWARLQRQAASGELSATKVYFPFWFEKFTAHMGPPRGMTTRMSMTSTRNNG